MEPLLPRLITRAAPRAPRRIRIRIRLHSHPLRPTHPTRVTSILTHATASKPFTTSRSLPANPREGSSHDSSFAAPDVQDSSYSQPAGNLSHNVQPAETSHFERIEAEAKERQRASPWTRAGSATPPVARARSAGAMVKGKLLTTPSRMLKFIIPLSPRDTNGDRKDVEPLALLVHPQQPLSYLERLVQSELPVLEDGKPPAVTFRAEDKLEKGEEFEDEEGAEGNEEGGQGGEEAGKEVGKGSRAKERDGQEEGGKEELRFSQEDTERIGGKVARTGKLNLPGGVQQSNTAETSSNAQSSTKDEPSNDAEPSSSDTSSSKDQSSSTNPSDPEHPDFVRWSPSTEIGDFIRDAARGKEFAIDIEGAGAIYVGVPSFADRTYYLRSRLRKTSRRILELADVKQECDKLAQRGAQRVAQMGFGALLSWWGLVFWLTFKTSLGWDVMEPVTYLVGLSGLIGGYTWFLYHNREVSYRSAMNFTVSRRQNQLYEAKGFRLQQWEMLVEEGNRLRREIKMVADEYDVEWDETQDEGHEKVREALRAERKKHKGEEGEKKKKGKDEDEDEGDD